jgi:hypothetical protein
MKVKAPRKYLVVVTVTPTKRNGLKTPFTSRVCGANTIKEALAGIEQDKRDICGTLGGLIDAPGIGGREYQVFEATWKEIDIVSPKVTKEMKHGLGWK